MEAPVASWVSPDPPWPRSDMCEVAAWDWAVSSSIALHAALSDRLLKSWWDLLDNGTRTIIVRASPVPDRQ